MCDKLDLMADFKNEKIAMCNFEMLDNFIEIIGGDVDFAVFDFPEVLPVDIEFLSKATC